MALAMVSSKPSAVDRLPAHPAITRPVINGSPATSGMDRTTKSVERITKSAHCTMPSPFLSTTVEFYTAPELHPAWQLADHGANEVAGTALRAKAA